MKRFLPGDLVSLEVPREDWAATDNLRMFCRVVREGSKAGYYELQSQFGVLKRQHPVEDLLRVPESARETIEPLLGDERKKVALSVAAGMFNFQATITFRPASSTPLVTDPLC